MLHLRNQVLQNRVSHIADEQIALAVARRQELLFAIRGFRYRRLKITKAEQGVN